MTFAVEVGEWILKTRRRSEVIIKESVHELVRVMQTPVLAGGNMPVDTGFLRASIRASYTTPITPVPGFKPVSSATYRPNGSVQRQINAMEPGQKIYIGYTAEYANLIEYGSAGRPPRAFVRLAAQQWPRIVESVANQVKARDRGK